MRRDEAARLLAVDASTIRVVTALRAVGIEPIVLKGPSFAAWIYGPHEIRPYQDTDLLIPLDRRTEAGEVLKRLGYRMLPFPPELPPPSTTWLPGAVGAAVDLHHDLWGWGGGRKLWESLQAQTERMSLGHIEVTVLNPPARTLHVVTHALQNAFRNDKANGDLERAIALVPAADWKRAWTLAVQVEAYEAFVLALLNFQGGVEIISELGVDARIRIADELRLFAGSSSRSGARSLLRLRNTRGFRRRVSFVRARLCPPPEWAARVVDRTGERDMATYKTYLLYWRQMAKKFPGAVRTYLKIRGQKTQ